MLNLRPMNEKDMNDFVEGAVPSVLENIQANIAEGFDNTTTGIILDQFQENRAAGFDIKSEQGLANHYGIPISGTKADPTLKTLTKAEWEKSPYFRQGVSFEDGWSEGRAKHLAEGFDKRQERETVISRGGWISGFAGQMIGSLPDPINFIPIAEGFKAGKIATKLAAGAVEGAAGNVMVSAATRPYYEERGVDSDFADYLNDTFIGAVMGGGFAGLGHGVSRLREIRSQTKMKDRKVVGEAAEKSMDAVATGEEIKVEEMVPEYKEAIKNMRSIEDLMKTEEISKLRTQLEGLGYSKEEIDSNLSIMATQAEFFAQYQNKTFGEALADFQAGEMQDGKIVNSSGEEFAKSKQMNELVDSELMAMAKEVKEAEVNGGLIFNEDGSQVVNAFRDNTYPDWYKDLGVKNKDHFEKVMSAKKGPIYERIKQIAEDRLLNGYESQASGRVEPSNEFRKLKGEEEAYYQATYGGDKSNPAKRRLDGTQIESGIPLPESIQIVKIHSPTVDLAKGINRSIKGEYFNPHAGKTISIDESAIRKINSFIQDKVKAKSNSTAQNIHRVASNIDQVIDRAILSEKTIGPDDKGRLFDIYESVTELNGKDHLVQLQVNQKTGKLYNIKVSKELKKTGRTVTTEGSTSVSSKNASPSTVKESPRSVTISDFKEKIKEARKDEHYQTFKKNSAENVRGAFQVVDGKKIISLFKNADRSTIIHETGHLMLKNLQDLADSGNGMAKADLQILKKSFGFDANKKLSAKEYETFHEYFARGFERYLMEGKAPRNELEGVFSRFANWLKSIYQQVEKLNVPLSDDARAIYAKLLGGERAPETLAPEAPKFKSEEELDQAAEKFAEGTNNQEDLKGLSPEDIQTMREVLDEIKSEESAADEAFTLFQTGNSDDALAKLKDAGLSKSKMDELVDAFNNKLLSEDEKRLALEKAIEEQKIALAAEAKELKRQAYLSSEARLRVGETIQAVIDAGGSAKQAILSQIEGDSTLRGVKGAGNSVDGSYTALAHSTSSRAYGELRKLDENIENLFENDIQFNERVAKEIITPGSTGDELAQKAGEILSRFEEEVRVRANLAGATIRKLEGHIARSHEPDKMFGRRSEWIAFMKENLDFERSFKGVGDLELDAALSDTFDRIVTGEFNNRPTIDPDAPLMRPSRNIAKKMGEARELHFKTAEAEVSYLKEFGQGNNILETFFGQYERMAKKIALMEKLGPNPESTVAYFIETTRKAIRDGELFSELDDAGRDKILKDLGTVQELKSRDSDIGAAMMHALGEVDTRDGWFKNMSRIIRAVNSMAKLGSAVLSQPTDFVHAVNEKRIMTNKNYLSAWIETLQDYGMGSDKKYQEILDYAGIFVDGINYKNFNRFDGDNINQKMARWQDKLFRWSGQNWHVKHAKNGAALALSRELGNNIDKPWNQIHPGLKEVLTQYGSMDSKKWDILRKSTPLEIDGKKFYHPGLIDNILDEDFEAMLPEKFRLENRPDNSQADLNGDQTDITAALDNWEKGREVELKRARNKLSLDLQTFFVEEGRNIAPEPDAKVRRIMTIGAKSGSNASEAIKLVTQFKAFAFVNWDRSIKGKRMMRDSRDYGGLIHHAAATLALGYASTVLKDLAKGYTPADPSKKETWGRAAMQSGGLGIMGDFFGSAYSARSGSDAISTLAGPTLSTLSNVSVLTLKGLHGETYEDGSQYASKWVDLARSVAPSPLSTLVWSRAAMDALVWSQIKEGLEPGSISRTKRRLKKEFNQKYIIDPKM